MADDAQSKDPPALQAANAARIARDVAEWAQRAERQLIDHGWPRELIGVVIQSYQQRQPS